MLQYISKATHKSYFFVMFTDMRLHPQEVEIIKEAVLRLDPQARVFLFGSRADPARKGGDIDLLILSSSLKNMDTVKILKRIYEKMDEQKIDILIASETKDPFVQIALEKGVEL